MSMFTIDFFEFAFLVEACIPPRPIARAMFWKDVINKHYNNMSDGERAKLHEWITKNTFFNKENEDCQWFDKRFDPDNQYNVKVKGSVIPAFKHKDRYYVGIDTWVSEDLIESVDKIEKVKA